MAGVRRNFGESRISKNLVGTNLNYSTIHFVILRCTIAIAILMDSGWFFWVKSTVRLFFKVRNLKNVWYF